MIYSAGRPGRRRGGRRLDQLRPLRRHHRRARGLALVPQPGDRARTSRWRPRAPPTTAIPSSITRPSTRSATRGPATPILNMLERQRDRPLGSDGASSPARSGAGGGRLVPGRDLPRQRLPIPSATSRFREFAIIYHDEIGAVQAFPQFDGSGARAHPAQRPRRLRHQLRHRRHRRRDPGQPLRGRPDVRLHRVQIRRVLPQLVDGGRSGHGRRRAGELAVRPRDANPNNLGQDPNLPLFVDQRRSGAPCTPLPNAKATKAFFPDDPSNVYHSYLSDHVRFRVLHAGSKEHHIHHLHAHQWLYTADSDKSSYLDSQAIGPGTSFTAEIAYDGSGNRNQTVGDSIFHCHFYPHFAQGMWSLWRVHDVLEVGTPLDENGRPAAAARAPCRTARSPPARRSPPSCRCPASPWRRCPGGGGDRRRPGAGDVSDRSGNPGYPFFVPARRRAPAAPAAARHDRRRRPAAPHHHRRHLSTRPQHPARLPQDPAHRASARRSRRTAPWSRAGRWRTTSGRSTRPVMPDGTCGADFHRPTARSPVARRAVSPTPAPAEPRCDRTYKAADIQDDVKLNKEGWHFPQQRFTSLWQDVNAFLGIGGGTKKPPEPLFFRANSGDCIEYQLTNLVPNEYKQDDFQVRTPTDILGQHIHLVKFDVTGLGRRRQRLQLRGRHLLARRGARAHQRDPRPERLHDHATRATAPSPARWPSAHPFFGAGPANALAGRPDHRAALVGRSGAGQRRQRPHAAHGLHPRPLRPLDPPAGRPLRRPGDRAGGLDLVAQRDAARRSAQRPPSWTAGRRAGRR